MSTRPHFLSLATWEGTSTGMRPRFSGMKQLVARCVDMVYTPLLEQLLWWMIGLSAVLHYKSSSLIQYQ